MGKFIMTLAMSFAGLFFAFLRGWYLSILMLCVFPAIFFMMGSVFKIMEVGFKSNLKAYG